MQSVLVAIWNESSKREKHGDDDDDHHRFCLHVKELQARWPTTYSSKLLLVQLCQ